MVVKLVVVERDDCERFSMCFGGSVADVRGEVFLSDDRRPKPIFPIGETYTMEDIETEQKGLDEWESFHYPFLHDESRHGVDRYLSRDYLASLVLGTTGWSGVNKDHEYWTCRKQDLNSQGLALYEHLQVLYPNADVHLLTFLDT